MRSVHSRCCSCWGVGSSPWAAMIVAAKCAGSRNEVGKIGNMRPCCRARTRSNFPETATVAAITSATTAWTAALAPQALKQEKTEWRQTFMRPATSKARSLCAGSQIHLHDLLFYTCATCRQFPVCRCRTGFKPLILAFSHLFACVDHILAHPQWLCVLFEEFRWRPPNREGDCSHQERTGQVRVFEGSVGDSVWMGVGIWKMKHQKTKKAAEGSRVDLSKNLPSPASFRISTPFHWVTHWPFKNPYLPHPFLVWWLRSPSALGHPLTFQKVSLFPPLPPLMIAEFLHCQAVFHCLLDDSRW